jgi:Tfp pilus assembly protein PilV
MTIVEVVIASAILFFIMTAIIGLVGRTTVMAGQAKQMNDVNNAISTYVEWMRALPFAELDSLESTTIPTGDYTVQIIPTVEESGNQYLKNVWLAVTVTQPNGFLRVINEMVVIHDRDQYMSQSAQGIATDPTIIFLAASPPDQTVVWLKDGASYWKDASGVTRSFQISARALASEGRTVDEVYFQLEDTYDLKCAISGATARWMYPTWTDSPIVNVDLGQLNSDGQAIFREGLRSVQVFVKDSNGVIRQDMRQYLVDNRAPDGATAFVDLDDRGPGSRQFVWGLVMDGTTPAHTYAFQLRQQPETASTTYSQWPQVKYYEGRLTGYEYTGQPMTRYMANVIPLSPRRLAAPIKTAYVVTRPTLSGSYVINKRTSTPKGWTVTASLSVTPPSFESTGTTYAWYDGSSLMATTAEPTYKPAVVSVEGDPNTTPFPARTYSVVVTTKPLSIPSFANNPIVSRTSNAVTTVSNTSGTYDFTEGTW